MKRIKSFKALPMMICVLATALVTACETAQPPVVINCPAWLPVMDTAMVPQGERENEGNHYDTPETSRQVGEYETNRQRECK